MNQIIHEDIQTILQEDLNWTKLKDSRVLLTGASGMLGSYILFTLAELNRTKGYNIDITALVRHPRKLDAEVREEISVLQQSVTDPIPEEYSFDYVLHTASPASPLIMREDPVGTIAANVLGTWNTLQAAHRSGARGYLFISSREIYGQPLEGQEVFTESTYGFVDPLDPRSCYPEGKKAAETMCASFHAQHGMNAKAVRLAHTLGPGMSVNDGRVQADFLRDVINHRDIVLKSEGTAIRTYTYVRDAVSGIFYILLNAPEDEIAYNISSEDATVSIRQLAEAMVSAFPERGLSLRFEIPEEKKNTGTAPFTAGILSSDKIKTLGWEPKVSLREGIIRTVMSIEMDGRS